MAYRDPEKKKKWTIEHAAEARARAKAWAKANPERKAAHNRASRKRHWNVEKMAARINRHIRHGWVGNSFEIALYVQDGKCFICGYLFKGENEVMADHDHATGKRRDLLCVLCNTRLGVFEKHRDLYEVKFPEYLKRWANGAS